MIPNSDVLNWIISPAGDCGRYVAEETKLASLLHQGLVALSNVVPTLAALRHRLAAIGVDVTTLDRLVADQSIATLWAKDVIDSDFQAINSHSLVGIWCAVEVAVEDTVVLILTKDPTVATAIAQMGIDTSKLDFAKLDEEGARRLFRRLEAKFRNAHRVGEAWVEILRPLGVVLAPSKRTLDGLAEVNAVRNCLLHRGGIIDEKAASQAPALTVGSCIQISRNRYLEYFRFIGDFSENLMNAALKSRFFSVQLKHLESDVEAPRILGVNYDAIKEAILAALPVGARLSRGSLVSRVREQVHPTLSGDAADPDLLVSCVVDDLEARRCIAVLWRHGLETIQRGENTK